jgi:Ca-activated chloride channel family protein
VSFVHPERLWLLTAFALLCLWAIRGRLRRRRGWQALAQRGRAPRDGTPWLLSSAAFLIIAMVQPRWGRLGSPRPPGHDAILLIDVSRSMGAEDAVPNRLAVAVEAAEKLVDALAPERSNRAAVVAFAGRGVLRCPLTENLGAVIDALHRLRPGAVRPGGTDLGAGLDAAIEAIGAEEHAQGQAIVVFSDGEDLANQWRSRLGRLRQQEVVVHAVTIGDADHDQPVPSGVDDKPLMYRGAPVRSRRSDTALEAIAQETGGMVVRLGLTAADLGTLYRTRIEPAARRHRELTRISDLTEQFPLFLAAALTCLLAGCWPPGRGWSWRGGWSWRRSAKVLARASLAVTLAVAITGAGQPRGGLPVVGDGWWQPAPVFASNPSPVTRNPAQPESAADLVARGRDGYGAGRLDEALTAFEAAVRLVPDAAVPRYNAAAVLFGLGQYDAARRRYIEARPLADPALRTKIDFALGNTALALGDIPAAIVSYNECIASTVGGAGLDVVREDAAINRDFAYKQAQSPAMPPAQGSDDPSSSRRPDRKRATDRRNGGDDPSSEREPETGPTADGTNPEDDAGRSAARDRPPSKRRRLGGAGGSRSTPPGAEGESPQERLESALENIRAAQSRRLPEEPPSAAASDDRRDW